MRLRPLPGLILAGSVIQLVQCVSLLTALTDVQQLLPWSRPTTVVPKEINTEEIAAALSKNVDLDGMSVDRVLDFGTHMVLGETELSKFAYKRKGVGFMDITEHYEYYSQLEKRAAKSDMDTESIYPGEVTHKEQVEELIKKLDTRQMKEDLIKLTSFHNRYYKSQYGLNASLWIFEQLQELAEVSNKKYQRSDNQAIRVKQFDHRWAQKSIIATIPASGPHRKNEPVVVLSSHLDSTNYFFPYILASPGADDNGSGTVALLDIFRVFVTSGIKFHTKVEFHFYSAEEGGLLGSQDVMASYKRKNTNVKALFHQDMMGYPSVPHKHNADGKFKFAVIIDYVSPSLTEFLKLVINTFSSLSFIEQQCGYACSDHGSAHRVGYPSSFMVEGDLKRTSPWVHTVGDTVDRIQWDHVLEHGKIGLGMIYELGMWNFLK